MIKLHNCLKVMGFQSPKNGSKFLEKICTRTWRVFAELVTYECVPCTDATQYRSRVTQWAFRDTGTTTQTSIAMYFILVLLLTGY